MVQASNSDRTSSKVSRTFQKARPIFNHPALLLIPLVAIMLATSGCQTATSKLAAQETDAPFSRVFYANYEDVEIALRQATVRYPQKVDNTEAGIFETDYIKGEARFRAPHKTAKFSPGYRYRILVRLVRGRTEDRPAIKVQVTKRPEVMRDFFSDADSLKSDGLEEQVILYRIGRELQLARAVAKSSDKANKRATNPDTAPADKK